MGEEYNEKVFTVHMTSIMHYVLLGSLWPSNWWKDTNSQSKSVLLYDLFWKSLRRMKNILVLQLIQSLLVRKCMFQRVHKPLHLPYWAESQINCTTYDSFIHMGCHILSTVPLDSISWATSSALLDGEPNKLHRVWFFYTHRLSHFVNNSISVG